MIFYTHAEDTLNAITHAIGFVACMAFGLMFVGQSVGSPNVWALPGACLFAAGASASYLISALYHAWPVADGRRRELLREFDHAAIYWHIAGAYSIVTLTTLGCSQWWGAGLFLFIWAAALVGTYVSLRGLKEHSHLETAVYCLMGLSVLVVFPVFMRCVSSEAIEWLLAEGAAYLTGAAIYACSHNRPYIHTVFHIFVLIGTACHLFASLAIFADYV